MATFNYSNLKETDYLLVHRKKKLILLKCSPLSFIYAKVILLDINILIVDISS